MKKTHLQSESTQSYRYFTVESGNRLKNSEKLVTWHEFPVLGSSFARTLRF